MVKKIMKMTLLTLILFGSIGYAGVNIKNGNYFISYKDASTSSKGMLLELTRTYNSKSTTMGWTGYGWGTPFETRLENSADGSILVYENGTGGVSRFTPSGVAKKELVQKASDLILSAYTKKNKVSDKTKKEFSHKLHNDNFFRHKMAKQYDVSIKTKVGTVLESHNYGFQKMYVVAKGYKRQYDNGVTQFFNKDGDLLASTDKNGYKVRFKRNKQTKKVEKIFDSAGNQMFLEWNSQGLLSGLSIKGGRKAVYKYSKKNLISSSDINGFKYNYSYDRYHNLVSITDKRVKDKKLATMKIEYAPKSFFAVKVTDRLGDVTRYVYKSNPKNPDLHYWTTVIKKGVSGSDFANYYEYEHKKRKDGSQWLARTKFVTGADYKNKKIKGGIIQETVNNSHELPVKITQGKRVTNFEYKNGLLVYKKSSDGSFNRLSYDPKHKKVSKIQSAEGTISYVYNTKGELEKALDTKGRSVILFYDFEGRVSKMIEQKKKVKKTLAFRYNSQGKPIEITLNNKGKLLVKYDNYGQIKEIDPKGSREIASEISGSFESLIEMVRPAGVNLSL